MVLKYVIATLFTFNLGPMGLLERSGFLGYKDETYGSAVMAAIAGFLWRSADCIAFGNVMLGIAALFLLNAVVATVSRLKRAAEFRK